MSIMTNVPRLVEFASLGEDHIRTDDDRLSKIETLVINGGEGTVTSEKGKHKLAESQNRIRIPRVCARVRLFTSDVAGCKSNLSKRSAEQTRK
jgi:hypothetical protein